MQPLQPHEHWHIDVAYINIGGTFFFLCSLLDGYSAIKSWRKLARDDNKTEPPRKRLPADQAGTTSPMA